MSQSDEPKAARTAEEQQATIAWLCRQLEALCDPSARPAVGLILEGTRGYGLREAPQNVAEMALCRAAFDHAPEWIQLRMQAPMHELVTRPPLSRFGRLPF